MNNTYLEINLLLSIGNVLDKIDGIFWLIFGIVAIIVLIGIINKKLKSKYSSTTIHNIQPKENLVNFFKKSTENTGNHDNVIKKGSSEFQSSFTAEQKAAIFGCLITVAKCDGELHQNEINSIEQSAKVLGLDPIIDLSLINRLNKTGLDGMIPILNTLNESQKEWYIIAQHCVMHADGKVDPHEINYCLGIANGIGISVEEYKKILDKMDGIYDVFLK